MVWFLTHHLNVPYQSISWTGSHSMLSKLSKRWRSSSTSRQLRFVIHRYLELKKKSPGERQSYQKRVVLIGGKVRPCSAVMSLPCRDAFNGITYCVIRWLMRCLLPLITFLLICCLMFVLYDLFFPPHMHA